MKSAGRALVVTVSGRAWAGVYADKGGPILVDGLRHMGFDVSGPVVVPDGEPVRPPCGRASPRRTT